MNKNIKKALICLLQEEEKVSSWGICKINIDENSINFNVDGFLYKGSVSIKCNETYYEIHFEHREIIHCSDVGELTDILDSNIEKTENYQQDLEKWFSSFK